MEGNPVDAWFMGDLGDPWVLSLAEALPKGVPWVSCPGDLPEAWTVAEGSTPPKTLVLHRSRLNATDASRLSGLISSAPGPVRVILCVGSEVRYDELLRWARMVETVLPEATAADSLARRFAAVPHPAPRTPPPVIQVLSTDFEWRSMVSDLCRAGGYDAENHFDAPGFRPEGVAVWDVPVLRPDWPELLRLRAEQARVVAVIGFADRDIVELARRNGASACLDAPFDAEDLIWVLDRLTQGRVQPRVNPAHAMPPTPAYARHHRLEPDSSFSTPDEASSNAQP